MKLLLILILEINLLFSLDLAFSKAFMYFNKGIKLEKTNPQKAQEYFNKTYALLESLKDRANKSSQINYMLGRMYCNGWGVEKNYKLAEKYFKQALKLGNQRVNCCIARLYIRMGKLDLAKKYLDIATSHPDLKIYCNDIDIKNLKEKK